jgi:threonine/homoserine/homoserine lactone efflux protein
VLAHLVAFLALAGVIVAIPGPSVMLIVKSTILRGRRAAMLVAVGVLCGDLVWAAAAVGGITALIVASRPAFEVLRLAGAAYLVYLGLRLLLARGTHLDVRQTPGLAAGRSSHRDFGEGLLCELSNPKTLVVFTSVVPQFLSHHAPAGEVAIFGLLFAVLGFFSLTIYAAVLAVTRHAVRRRRLGDILLRASGGLLMFFGIGLVADQSA